MDIKPEINLVKIDGKPIVKLLEVTSAAIGRLYKPTAIRNEADAKAYEYEVMSKAKAKALILDSDTKDEIEVRVQTRVLFQERKNQENIETVLENSIKYLPETVSEKDVDPDWARRFFDKAQNISSELLQEAWAKVLAKEVSSPGSFSLRTLEVLSNLSLEEAELFKVACSISFDGMYLFKIGTKENFDKLGLTFGGILTLQAAGLIIGDNNLNVTIPKVGDGLILDFSGISVKITNPSVEKFVFNDYKFTPVGFELAKVIEKNPNTIFLDEFISVQKNTGNNIEKIVY